MTTVSNCGMAPSDPALQAILAPARQLVPLLRRNRLDNFADGLEELIAALTSSEQSKREWGLTAIADWTRPRGLSDLNITDDEIGFLALVRQLKVATLAAQAARP